MIYTLINDSPSFIVSVAWTCIPVFVRKVVNVCLLRYDIEDVRCIMWTVLRYRYRDGDASMAEVIKYYPRILCDFISKYKED